MSDTQRTSDPSDIQRRARELRGEFNKWLESGKYSPLSQMEEVTLDAFATWLLNGHTLKVKPRD